MEESKHENQISGENTFGDMSSLIVPWLLIPATSAPCTVLESYVIESPFFASTVIMDSLKPPQVDLQVAAPPSQASANRLVQILDRRRSGL